MNVHLFVCKEGFHLALWRLQVYWLADCQCWWKPWHLARTAYWLKFAFEWA